jgi:hypothetical protein
MPAGPQAEIGPLVPTNPGIAMSSTFQTSGNSAHIKEKSIVRRGRMLCKKGRRESRGPASTTTFNSGRNFFAFSSSIIVYIGATTLLSTVDERLPPLEVVGWLNLAGKLNAANSRVSFDTAPSACWIRIVTTCLIRCTSMPATRSWTASIVAKLRVRETSGCPARKRLRPFLRLRPIYCKRIILPLEGFGATLMTKPLAVTRGKPSRMELSALAIRCASNPVGAAYLARTSRERRKISPRRLCCAQLALRRVRTVHATLGCPRHHFRSRETA